jgi:hypothetical protein
MIVTIMAVMQALIVEHQAAAVFLTIHHLQVDVQDLLRVLVTNVV